MYSYAIYTHVRIKWHSIIAEQNQGVRRILNAYLKVIPMAVSTLLQLVQQSVYIKDESVLYNCHYGCVRFSDPMGYFNVPPEV